MRKRLFLPLLLGLYFVLGQSTLVAGTYSVQLQSVDLKTALRFLARISGLNLIVPEDISGTVNVRFEQVTVEDAIAAILKVNGLDYAIERGILRVGKGSDFTGTGEDMKTQVFLLKFALATEMVDKLKGMLSERGTVFADERTNALIIRERPAAIENVQRFLNDVDVKDSQVQIEAKIVEATREFSRALGIAWGVNMSGNDVNVTGLSTTVGTAESGRGLNVKLPATSPTSGLGLLIGGLPGGTKIDAQISAAEQRGDLRVLSEPTIVTSNGKPAKIRSGETLLIETQGSFNISAAGGPPASSGATLQKIETGVELNVTPQISAANTVKLKIDAKSSQADFSRTVDGNPVIVDNMASTTVLVGDKETTVIGGLVKFSGSKTDRDVPFLSKVPLVGLLFRSRLAKKSNTELMVFIKPVILRDTQGELTDSPLAQVQQMRDELEIAKVKKKTLKTRKPTNPHIRYRQDRPRP